MARGGLRRAAPFACDRGEGGRYDGERRGITSRKHAAAEGIAVAGLGSAPAAGEHGGRRRSERGRGKRKGHGCPF